MADMPDEEPVVALGCSGSVDYMDEYKVTLTSLGPTPIRVRKYLRKRFVYSLAEVHSVQAPTPLFSTPFKHEAIRVRIELGRLGAEVRIEDRCGPDSETYPELRIPLLHGLGYI